MTRKYDPVRRLISSFIIVVALMAVLVGLAQPARAATLTVAAGVVEIDGADGQCSLIEAIINANDEAATHPDCPAGNGADIIELASGSTYTVIQHYSYAQGLPTITDDLTIEGNNAILTNDPAQVYNLRYFSNNAGNELLIRNLTIEKGNRQSHGGAIYNSGLLRIVSSTLRDNHTVTSDKYGGAIYQAHQDSSLIVSNSTFENNHAMGQGGAIYTEGGGPVKIINSTLTSNGAGNDLEGGAVYYDGINGAILEIRGSTFTANSVSTINTASSGGAVYVTHPAPGSYIAYSDFDGNEAYGGGALGINAADYFEIDHSTFTNNVADAAGGAITGSKFHLLFSTVQGNSANYGGGLNPKGDFILTQTAVIGNHATTHGGGINISTQIFTVVHGDIKRSEISENTADSHGGGIRVEGNADLVVSHSTISGNRAENEGGGLFISGSVSYPSSLQSSFNSIISNSGGSGVGGFYLGSDAEMVVRNTALLNNTTDAAGSVFHTCESSGAFTTGAYNRYPGSALSGCSTLFTAANDDAVTGPTGNIDLMLQNNGGRTRTHAIVSGGALDNEIPDGVNGCVAGERLDQRGYTRAGGSGAGGNQCDVGAYELNAICNTPVAPTTSITISASTDALISWTQPTENYSTELWRSTDPYFDPTSPGNRTPRNTLDETYTFYDDVGDASDNNHYYAIRGLAGCGTESADVERAGEFDFALTPGTP